MKLRTLIKRSSRVIDIRCRDSGVGGRAGECVGEGVEGVDMDVVVRGVVSERVLIWYTLRPEIQDRSAADERSAVFRYWFLTNDEREG